MNTFSIFLAILISFLASSLATKRTHLICRNYFETCLLKGSIIICLLVHFAVLSKGLPRFFYIAVLLSLSPSVMCLVFVVPVMAVHANLVYSLNYWYPICFLYKLFSCFTVALFCTQVITRKLSIETHKHQYFCQRVNCHSTCLLSESWRCMKMQCVPIP